MRKKSQDYAKFIKWMWDQRGDVDKPFGVKSVTSEGSRKDTFPGEALSIHEAEGLFRFLEAKNLVTPQVLSNNKVWYSLNVVEHYKWDEVIRELSKPDWQRSWFFREARDRLFWIVSLIVAAFIGASSKHIIDYVTHEFNWVVEPAATALPVVGHESHVLKQEDKPKNPDESKNE